MTPTVEARKFRGEPKHVCEVIRRLGALVTAVSNIKISLCQPGLVQVGSVKYLKLDSTLHMMWRN